MTKRQLESLELKKKWIIIFEDFIDSKLPIRTYCRKNNVNRSQFSYWKQVLALDGFKFESPFTYKYKYDKIYDEQVFMEFNLSELTTNTISETIKIKLDGLVIKLDAKNNNNFIKKLIAKLEELL